MGKERLRRVVSVAELIDECGLSRNATSTLCNGQLGYEICRSCIPEKDSDAAPPDYVIKPQKEGDMRRRFDRYDALFEPTSRCKSQENRH